MFSLVKDLFHQLNVSFLVPRLPPGALKVVMVSAMMVLNSTPASYGVQQANTTLQASTIVQPQLTTIEPLHSLALLEQGLHH
jgi:hypothetical protein